MPYPRFDRSRLKLKPLAERVHDLELSHWLSLDDPTPSFVHPDLPALAERILTARAPQAAAILMVGGHAVRAGVARHLIDLLERGLITHIGTNGAGAIHDYELALIGATTESVARYIRSGQFGLWQETGRMNDVIAQGAREGLGLGEALGRAIEQGDFPHRDLSLLAAAYRLRVPLTVHVGIGYDIIHEHPNCDGAAIGAASCRDFLVLAESIVGLNGGVVLSFGSAVMAPETFLKGLAMARNVAQQEGHDVADFTTAVFDLLPLSGDLAHEARKSTPEYYFRPYKTLLVHTLAGNGESHYFQGEHQARVPALRRLLVGGA